MTRNLLVAATLSAALLSGCHGHHQDHDDTVVVSTPPLEPRPVSIEVEVYDPQSGYVWQDVGVRIVEAYTEWTDSYFESPLVDDFYYTDASGIVYFDEFVLADADVGFAEDFSAGAVLEPYASRDEAIVTLEIWGPGFAPVFVDVELDWDNPDVFVSVPFE